MEIDGTWLVAVRVEEGKTFVGYQTECRAGKGWDRRALGDERDSDGRQFLDFREPPRRSREEKQEHFPLRGPRAFREIATAIRDAGQLSWDEHHTV